MGLITINTLHLKHESAITVVYSSIQLDSTPGHDKILPVIFEVNENATEGNYNKFNAAVRLLSW